jgi:very-short-patch-repair endonuclease
MTRAEIVIWRELRAGRFAGFKFRRQVPFGPYIVDFICFAARLVVELDGEPHEKPDQQMHDTQRDAWLTSQGSHVLRVKNELVLGNADLVLDEIGRTLRIPRSSSA